ERGDTARWLSRNIAIFQDNAPSVRFVEAGNHVQQRGLPRAVRTDDRQDASSKNVDRHLIDCPHPAEPFANTVHRHLHGCCCCSGTVHAGVPEPAEEANPDASSHRRWHLPIATAYSPQFCPALRTTLR